MDYKKIDGNLIELAKTGSFDVIVHGCNCFCTMELGISKEMSEAYGVGAFPLEEERYKGSINKLGVIDGQEIHDELTVVNAYTQFEAEKEGMSLNYQALILCLQKINKTYAGKKVGLPKIGCGRAGGDWKIVEGLIKKHMTDVDVTVVEYIPF